MLEFLEYIYVNIKKALVRRKMVAIVTSREPIKDRVLIGEEMIKQEHNVIHITDEEKEYSSTVSIENKMDEYIKDVIFNLANKVIINSKLRYIPKDTRDHILYAYHIGVPIEYIDPDYKKPPILIPDIYQKDLSTNICNDSKYQHISSCDKQRYKQCYMALMRGDAMIVCLILCEEFTAVESITYANIRQEEEYGMGSIFSLTGETLENNKGLEFKIKYKKGAII